MLHVQCTVDTLATYKLLPGMSCYMLSALLTHWQHTSCYLACHVTCSVHCWHIDNIQVVTWHVMLHVQCTVGTLTTYKLLPGMSCYMFSALLTQSQHTSCHLARHVTCSVHCWHSHNIQVVTWHGMLHVQCTVATVTTYKLSPGTACYMFSALLPQSQHTSCHLARHVTCSVHCWHSDNIWVVTWHIMLHVQCTIDTVTTYKSSPGISCYIFSALFQVVTWHVTLHVQCTIDTVTTYKSSPGISCYIFSGIPSTYYLVRE